MTTKSSHDHSFGRFKRIAQMFEEIARAHRVCDNTSTTINGSNDDESSPELSDLINSFFEMSNDGEEEKEEYEKKEQENSYFSKSKNNYLSTSKTSNYKEMLKDLLGCNNTNKDGNDDDVKMTIRAAIEPALQIIGATNPSDVWLKRYLVNRLRRRGFNSGLCKTQWENMAVDYEYVDVIVDGTRYIIEVGLVEEFTIARPTKRYLSLLDEFPQIFVGKPDELKQVVKLMCTAAKESMKNKDMHVGPWRTNEFMQAKWFGSYNRLTYVDETAAQKVSLSGKGSSRGKRSEGVEAAAAPVHPSIYQYYYCGLEVEGKVG